MTYATIEDLTAFSGDKYLNAYDIEAAEKLIEYASAIIDERFARAGREPGDAPDVIKCGVVCNMVLRVMDSFKRSDDAALNVYDGDPFAATSFFNYRGKMQPTYDELESLGLPRKHTAIGTAAPQWL